MKNINSSDFIKTYQNLPKPWVCFAGFTEVNRIWPQENFAELADKLFEKNLAKQYLLSIMKNIKNIFKKYKNSKYRVN